MSGAAADYRHTSLLLSLINVTEPISKSDLLSAMGDTKEEDVEAALELLISRGLAKQLPGKTYRTTWAGQEAQSARVLRQGRDVHRMWRLSELSDEIRRSGEGEAS